MSNKIETLTDKQRMFVKEYLVDLNASAAALRAGYSKKTAGAIGYENLKKPQIQAAIQIEIKEREKRTEITADYVLDTIKETVERCRQKVSPVFDKKGFPVVTEDRDGEMVFAFVFDAKNVLKGCELLGRHLKLWNDKLDVGIDPDDPIGQMLMRISGKTAGKLPDKPPEDEE